MENPCARASCPWGGACVTRGGAAQCACPVCDAALAPVCASDRNTYGSECKMRMHACQEGLPDGHLRVLYNGTCREYHLAYLFDPCTVFYEINFSDITFLLKSMNEWMDLECHN